MHLRSNKSNNSCDMVVTMQVSGTSRPGGRSERVRSSVLRATQELLAQDGYEALRVEDVASRAGVHKTTIYRRWPTKADLVMAVVDERSVERVPVPDTGSLEGDLGRFARSIVDNLRAEGGQTLARTLVTAADGSPELRDAAVAFWAGRFALASEIVARAAARHEIPEHTDADALIETLIGPLYVRALLTDGELDHALADRAARVVAAAARSGALVESG
jgi:AcrR family transcriptional regulator